MQETRRFNWLVLDLWLSLQLGFKAAVAERKKQVFDFADIELWTNLNKRTLVALWLQVIETNLFCTNSGRTKWWLILKSSRNLTYFPSSILSIETRFECFWWLDPWQQAKTSTNAVGRKVIICWFSRCQTRKSAVIASKSILALILSLTWLTLHTRSTVRNKYQLQTSENSKMVPCKLRVSIWMCYTKPISMITKDSEFFSNSALLSLVSESSACTG